MSDSLEDILAQAAPPEGLAWLRGAARPDLALEDLLRASGQAPRRLGRRPLAAPAPQLETPFGPLGLHGLAPGDLGRMLLLLRVARACPGEAAERRLMRDWFNAADDWEKAALMRVLVLLPHPGRHLPLALEVQRTNNLVLFASLALDNPFPARFHDQEAFDALVLKCLFTGLGVARIQGLGGRADRALADKCAAYIEERRLAGRGLPPDIWLALAPGARGEVLGLLRGALADPDPAQRRFAALAALRHQAAPLAADLARRRDLETDPGVRAVLGRPDSSSPSEEAP